MEPLCRLKAITVMVNEILLTVLSDTEFFFLLNAMYFFVLFFFLAF